MPVHFPPVPTDEAVALRAGKADANGQSPEVHVAEESGLPCRHCLRRIAAGERYLILAYRPFPAPQPYAEIGPIFLHADPCPAAPPSAELPPMLTSAAYILRGYGADDRIVYGSGKVVAPGALATEAEALFAEDRIAYAHVRSSTNNCYQCRIDRAWPRR